MQTVISSIPEEKCAHILLEIGFPAHRAGYKQLKCGIPRFAEDKQQSITSELYPYIADALGYSDWRAVERSIGRVIEYTWKHGIQDSWEKYFPGCKDMPTNKRFIATIAEHI